MAWYGETGRVREGCPKDMIVLKDKETFTKQKGKGYNLGKKNMQTHKNWDLKIIQYVSNLVYPNIQ